MRKHTYGLIPDKADERDYQYVRTGVALPPLWDMRNIQSPVIDQDGIGCCTGASFKSMRESMMNTDGEGFTALSMLFPYYWGRTDDTKNQDSGANIRDVFKGAAKYGICSDKLWPFDPATFKNVPTETMMKDAQQYKIATYRRLTGLQSLKECLFTNHAAVIGMAVYDSFEDANTAKDGVMVMPGIQEKLLGYHAVLAVGYEDDKSFNGGGCMIVKNSWGNRWGARGYFFMPYAFVNPDYVFDMWTCDNIPLNKNQGCLPTLLNKLGIKL